MNEVDLPAITSIFASGSDHQAEEAARELVAFGSQNLTVFSQLLIDHRVDVR